MHHSPHISDEHIIPLMQSDSRKAVELLLQKYGGALLWSIRKMVPSDEIAQDLLQDGAIKIWKNAEKYDPDKGKLFTWCLQICRNTALDKIRTQKFQRHSTSETIEETVINTSSVSEEMQISDIGLLRQLQRLDPKYQEIIELIYFQGYTHSEVTKEFGIPLGTVKSRVKIALRELRNIFGTTATDWIIIIWLISHFFNV